MVLEIIIIRPNWYDTSSNILLYSFSVQNNTSNIKIWFRSRYLHFSYFAVFIGHPTRGEADSGWPKAIDKSPSAGRCRPRLTLRFPPSIAVDSGKRRRVAWSTTADQTWPSTAIPTFMSAVFPQAWHALCWVRVWR